MVRLEVTSTPLRIKRMALATMLLVAVSVVASKVMPLAAE